VGGEERGHLYLGTDHAHTLRVTFLSAVARATDGKPNYITRTLAETLQHWIRHLGSKQQGGEQGSNNRVRGKSGCQV
jgi:hypothetical protein